jgi:CubicO group peptidase (beta-lactamase class C family)
MIGLVGKRVSSLTGNAAVVCMSLGLIAGLGLVGCGPGDAVRDEPVQAVGEYDTSTMAAIARVENGLLPRTRVDGESGWTLGERMDRWNVEAVSVAVIADFEIAWAKAWGLADREEGKPVTTETLFQAGSISKPVAATGALRMVEEGLLSLDRPVNDFLTSWQLPDNGFTDQTPVTIRHLLSHTAGTTVHGFPGYAPWEPVPTVPQVLDGAPPANTAAVLVDIPPGSQVRYSGGGTTIVQLAMTDVSAEPFPALLHRLVLEPAGMVSSTYENPLPAGRLAEAAAGYRQNGSPVPGKRHTYPEMQAAGLWTTPSDLARFAIAMQNSLRESPGGVLKPETARDMVTPVMESAGLGFFIDDEEGAIYFQHGGADEGFQALLIASRDGGYGVAVMANSDNGGAIATEIMRAVALEYGWEGILEDPVEAIEMTAEELTAYEGRYRLGPGEIVSLKIEGGALVSRVTLQPTGSRMFPLGKDVFLLEERGEKLGFVSDAEGDVVAVTLVDRPGNVKLERLSDDRLLPVELLEAGRTEEALEALSSEDAAEAPVNLLGYALLTAGRPEQAVAVFRWNAQRHPTHANPWDSLADGLRAVGDEAGAVAAYRKVLEAIPLDAESDSAALANLEQRARAGLEELGGS